MSYSERTERAYGVDPNHPMQKDVPEGYRKPRGSEYVGFAYSCLNCGANVSPSAVDQHNNWHQRLWERIGKI